MIVEASIDRLQELGSKWRIFAEKDGEPVAVAGFGQIDATSMQGILYGLTGMTAGGMGNFLDVPISTIGSDGSVVTSTLSVPGFAALFNLNEFEDAVNVLSTPQILTSDNKEAEIIVGEKVPFLGTSNINGAVSQQSIERKDTGITLKITPGGTAYITDVGMTGPHDSVLGVETAAALGRFLNGLPVRFETASGLPKLHAVVIEADSSSGRALRIERLSLTPEAIAQLGQPASPASS